MRIFAPEGREAAALASGLLQCITCGLVWFGGSQCPEGPHGEPVQVVLVCRSCDLPVAVHEVGEHLCHPMHTVRVGDRS